MQHLHVYLILLGRIMVLALALRSMMTKLSLRDFICAIIIFWQAMKLRRLRVADDNGQPLVEALRIALAHRPGGDWKLAFGWKRGSQDHVLSDFTLAKVKTAAWLLKETIPARFEVALGTLQRARRYIAIQVTVFYDGQVVNVLNAAGKHHISLFEGSGCQNVDIDDLERKLMPFAHDILVLGFLAAQPKMFQTSMRVKLPDEMKLCLNRYVACIRQLYYYKTTNDGDNFHIAI